MRFGIKGLCVLSLAVFSSFPFGATLSAQKGVMGQLELQTSSKPVRTCGVWIDGEYVGYLGELQGSNRLKLLPGDHHVTVREAGYADFSEKVVIEPGRTASVHVVMYKDTQFAYPDAKTGSAVRLDVNPGRAAVFVDDYYFGTVDQYYGVDHAMLLAPGKHRFKIALPGFKAYETEIELSPRQKFELRANLLRGSINDADASIREETPGATSSASDSGKPAVR